MNARQFLNIGRHIHARARISTELYAIL